MYSGITEFRWNSITMQSVVGDRHLASLFWTLDPHMAIIMLNEFAAFIVGFVFNVILLVLIQRRTPSLMRPYALILRVHAVSDLLFDMTNFITSTHCYALGGRFFFTNEGIFATFLSPKMVSVSVRMYFWLVVYIPLLLLPMDFYYRLKAVCSGELLTAKTVIMFVGFGYSVSFIAAIPYNGLYLIPGPANGTHEYDEMLHKGVGRVISYVTMDLRGPLEMGILVAIVAVVFIDYGFIFYVVWRIREKMGENVRRNVSKKAEETHKHISRIMLVQATIPLVLCVPTSVNVVSALLLIDVPYFAPIVFSIISWMSSLKPLATICIVPHYRSSLFLRSDSPSSSSTPVQRSEITRGRLLSIARTV